MPRNFWKLKSYFHVGPKKAIVATATAITATEKEEQVVAATAQESTVHPNNQSLLYPQKMNNR